MASQIAQTIIEELKRGKRDWTRHYLYPVTSTLLVLEERMSSLALIAHEQGYVVSGSDITGRMKL